MRELTILTAQRATPFPARVAAVVRVRDPALEDRPVDVDPLPHDGQAKGIEVAEGGEVGRAEGSVRQVEVFRTVSLGTSILGDLDPYPRPLATATALQPRL